MLFYSGRYLDNKVFVSLATGEVIVYQREAGEVAVDMRCLWFSFISKNKPTKNRIAVNVNLQAAFGTLSLPKH